MVIADKNRQIARNTLLLYFRMLFSMGISLYASRIVLNTLGVEDYGIYNVVGGVVAMLSFFSNSLSSAASRFFTFEMGRNNLSKLSRVFSTSVTIHLFLAVIFLIVAELAGSWFLNNRMNIPVTRLSAANWVLQCSIGSFVVGIITIPYSAAIIAYERMGAFAYIGILDVVLRLLSVLSVAHFSFSSDKLITYSIMLSGVVMVTQSIYVGYCKKYLSQCNYHFIWDWRLIRDITGFAGWNVIGCSAVVLKDQGVNILLNLFYGPVVNAARGISYSVNAAINSFVGNFMTALNPQITKSFATGEQNYMESLVERGSRFSFYILLILALPVLLETDYILRIWLNEYPAYTVNFVRLALLLSMCDSLSNTLITLQLATGKIGSYQLAVGGTLLLNFPISYLLLRQGFMPEATIVVAICISIACLALRLIFLSKMAGLIIRHYWVHVLVNVMLVSVCSVSLPLLVYCLAQSGVLRFLSLLLICAVWTSGIVYLLGCSEGERRFIRERCKMFGKRILKR